MQSTRVAPNRAARAPAERPSRSASDAATISQRSIVEFLITFVLAFVVLAVATDSRAPSQGAPLAVVFALFAGVAIGGPISGGVVNPAQRSDRCPSQSVALNDGESVTL